MFAWEKIITLFVLVNASCILIDRFLLNRHKGKIYVYLYTYWDRLDDTKIPNFHKLMARSTLELPNIIPMSKRGLILIVIFLSSLLTCLSMVLGDQITLGWRWSNVIATMMDKSLYNFLLTGIPVNLFFDFITIYITFHVLKFIYKSKWIVAIPLMLLDLLAAFILAIMCHSVSWILDYSLFNKTIYPPLWAIPLVCFCSELRLLIGTEASEELLISIVGLILGPDYDIGDPPILTTWGGTLYALTTYIPTLIYFSVLLLLIFSKPILEIGKKSIMYFLEKATEVEDPKSLIVFTLAGAVFSFLGLLIKSGLALVVK